MTATAKFIEMKAEWDRILDELRAQSEDHFGTHPDELNWGDVGSLSHRLELLRRAREE